MGCYKTIITTMPKAGFRRKAFKTSLMIIM